MNSIKKKYLVACGDSFTQGHVMGKKGSWATYVGKSLQLQTINIACGGMSNDWICNTTLTWLMQNKEKAKDSVVMIGWSDFGRQHTVFQPVIETDFPNSRWSVTISPADFAPNFVDLKDPTIPQALREIEINRDALIPWFGSFTDCLVKTYRSILFVKEYCECNDIPYIMFDMIDNQKGFFKDEFSKQDGDIVTVSIRNRQDNEDGSHAYLDLGRVRDDQFDLLNPKTTNYLFDKHYCHIKDDNSLLGIIENYPQETKGGHDGGYMKGNQGHLNIEGSKWFSEYVVKWFNDLYNLELKLI